MHHFIFILAFLFLQEVPFKLKEEFEVKLDYQFKQRPSADHNTVHLGKDYERRNNASVLPYLVLNIKLLKLPGEKMRVRVTNNLREKPIFRKVDLTSLLELDLGFTDDMKDRVTAHQYTLTFINQDKTPVEAILINVDEDGSFFVNGEKRGKF
jgi:hypothetical protein